MPNPATQPTLGQRRHATFDVPDADYTESDHEAQETAYLSILQPGKTPYPHHNNLPAVKIIPDGSTDVFLYHENDKDAALTDGEKITAGGSAVADYSGSPRYLFVDTGQSATVRIVALDYRGN